MPRPDPTRRRLLRSAGLLPFAAAAGTDTPAPDARLPVRLSCNLYSFNAPLRSGAMSLEEVFEFCAELGFDAVDPTAYYLRGYPDVPPDAYLHEVKRRAFRLGLDISGTGVRNDFTQADAALRAADVALVDRWLAAASRLGAPCLRVFAGRGVPDGYDRATVTGWVAEGLRDCAARGAAHGVVVVLQNHAEFLFTADHVLDLLARVDSDWLAVNLDIGSFPTDDPYEDIARVAPYAATWQIKEQVRVRDRQEKTDLARILRIVRDAGYRGYLPIETLGEGDPRMKVRRFLDEVRTALA